MHLYEEPKPEKTLEEKTTDLSSFLDRYTRTKNKTKAEAIKEETCKQVAFYYGLTIEEYNDYVKALAEGTE